jgi:ethanolaminephosphotransferase
MAKDPATTEDSDWVNVPAVDGRSDHAWLREPRLPDLRGVISPSGLENIATHEYVPGSYTWLDNKLNPLWTSLTDMLPLWLAPNAVTTFGGMHCLFSYLVLWRHSPQFDSAVPDWTLYLAGYCTVAYYTLDCMDGKQARRTGQSSPLGQLFDHGFDCICVVAHLAAASTFLACGRTGLFFVLQGVLQFSFFMAQWEEYYTGVLPHCAGNFGVTEVNYGIGALVALNGLIDRGGFWGGKVLAVLPAPLAGTMERAFGPLLASATVGEAAILGNCAAMLVLIVLSYGRVSAHLGTDRGARLSAVSNLLSPLLLALCPFLLPRASIEADTRAISVATALLFSHITNKMITYSMAKMTYASLQPDVLLYVAACLWIRLDGRLTPEGGRLVVQAMCAWHAVRLLSWAGRAIHQICGRLDIWCLRIKHPKQA